jgi:hypothetical protein
VGASAELQAVSSEIVGIVNVMDRLNRFRFLTDAESLAVWESDSNVTTVVKSTEDSAVEQEPPAAGGEARPAA